MVQKLVKKIRLGFLDLIVGNNLIWNEHVKLILKKDSSGCYAIKRMSKLGNRDILKQIYFSHIHSHKFFIEYVCIAL